MTIIFHILASLCLVLMKTTLIPGVPMFDKFYDLLIPIVIYLGLFRSLSEGVPIILFFGIIMDSLCGGPGGLYLATYIWLYAGMRWLSRFLHTGNIVLSALAVAIGVGFESVLLTGYLVILSPDAFIPPNAAKTVGLQILWALITGPVILVFIGRAQKRLDIWRVKIFPDWLDMNGK